MTVRPDAAHALLSIVGAEAVVTLHRDERRVTFSGSVLVPFAEHRGGVLRAWGLKEPVHYGPDELLSAVAAESTIQEFRTIAARQAKTLPQQLGEPTTLSSHGMTRRRAYRPNGHRIRGLDLLTRSGASVDVLALIDGANQRWRGVVVRPPTSPTGSVEIRPHGISIESVTIEICIAQIVDVSEFDPHGREANATAQLQRARLPGGGAT